MKTKQKPNSFWIAWYECRPTVIQFDNTGEYFYALGQDAAWHFQHAELIQEVSVDKIAFNILSLKEKEKYKELYNLE